jgi:hypothetical protein
VVRELVDARIGVIRRCLAVCTLGASSSPQ